MKNINRKSTIQSLILLFALAVFGFFSSCNDDEVNTDQVVLLSFGPSGVVHGDEIIFVGQNLDKVTSVVFQPAITIEKSQFLGANNESFSIVVPQGAEAGKITLNTTKGAIESKTILNFKVDVEITSISGEGKPGTNITISGTKINWIDSIKFTSDIVVKKADYVSQSETELVVTVPLAAQTGHLIFYTGGTEPMSFGTEDEFNIPLPEVTSVSPAAVTHTGNITIAGNNLDLITEIVFGGDVSVLKADFVSQSESEIVVAVPVPALSGVLTLKQASPIDVVTVEELTVLLPAASGVSPSPAKPGVDNLTIIGTNLDLVAELILPGSGALESSNFISQSETEIVFAIPVDASQGAIEYVSIHDYSAPLGAVLKLPPTGDFPVLDYYIYKDGVEDIWSEWGGWGHDLKEFTNGDNPANGDYAIKVVFNDQYGAIQFGNDAHDTNPTPFDGYNYLVFYINVSGSDSADILVQIGNGADYSPPRFACNKYNQIVVPLSELDGIGDIVELRIKNNNADLPTTMFIDEVGLTVDEPMGLLPDLVSVMYDDAVQSPFSSGGGWGGASTDFASEEVMRAGSMSMKGVHVGGWGGTCQVATWGNTPLSTAGMTYLSFSIYGGTGMEGQMIQINVKSNTDGTGTSGSYQVEIKEGKWTDYKIALSDVGDPPSIGELSFQDTDWSGTIYVDHVGLE